MPVPEQDSAADDAALANEDPAIYERGPVATAGNVPADPAIIRQGPVTQQDQDPDQGQAIQVGKLISLSRDSAVFMLSRSSLEGTKVLKSQVTALRPTLQPQLNYSTASLHLQLGGSLSRSESTQPSIILTLSYNFFYV